MTPSDYADIIKNKVSMIDICNHYGIRVNRNRKALCPFHSDNHESMMVYPGKRGFFCFVCGVGGDVVDFVQRYNRMSFLDAIKDIDNAFGLDTGVNRDMTAEEVRRRNEAAYLARKERERKENDHRRLQDDYERCLDEVVKLEQTINENAPDIEYEDFNDKFADAVMKLTEAKDRLETAEIRLTEFERKERIGKSK